MAETTDVVDPFVMSKFLVSDLDEIQRVDTYRRARYIPIYINLYGKVLSWHVSFTPALLNRPHKPNAKEFYREAHRKRNDKLKYELCYLK